MEIATSNINSYVNHGIRIYSTLYGTTSSNSSPRYLCFIQPRSWNNNTQKLLTLKTTIHEDNIGALTLANLELGRHTPQSKFYALQLHWFCSWLKPQEIEIVHVGTKDQKADYLTKPLTSQLFKAYRKLSMGW
jgi:hypothetical protein